MLRVLSILRPRGVSVICLPLSEKSWTCNSSSSCRSRVVTFDCTRARLRAARVTLCSVATALNIFSDEESMSLSVRFSIKDTSDRNVQPGRTRCHHSQMMHLTAASLLCSGSQTRESLLDLCRRHETRADAPNLSVPLNQQRREARDTQIPSQRKIGASRLDDF